MASFPSRSSVAVPGNQFPCGAVLIKVFFPAQNRNPLQNIQNQREFKVRNLGSLMKAKGRKHTWASGQTGTRNQGAVRHPCSYLSMTLCGQIVSTFPAFLHLLYSKQPPLLCFLLPRANPHCVRVCVLSSGDCPVVNSHESQFQIPGREKWFSLLGLAVSQSIPNRAA